MTTFPRTEFEARAAKARAEMADAGVDVLLVDSGELLAWLTGYTGSETMYRAAFLPLECSPWFVLRSLDADPCRRRAWFDDVVGFPDTASPPDVMAKELSRRGYAGARIGVDTRSYGFCTHTAENLRRLLPDATFVPLPDIGTQLRARKSKAEVAVLRKASGIADEAMATLSSRFLCGMRPRDAAAIAAGVFLRSGADTGEVGPIVKAAGDNEFLHGVATDEPLTTGDILHVELVPKVAHYSARLMRSLVVGKPDADRARVAASLVALQDGQIAAMRAGAVASAVDAIMREGAVSAGLRARYENVTAYTLGLVARTPRTSDFSYVFLPTSDWRLESGMVFHVYASAAGIAFSETVLVTEGGGERLTSFPRELVTIPVQQQSDTRPPAPPF